MIRLAAVSDLHYTLADEGKVRERLSGVSSEADLLLLPGDLINGGTEEEAHSFVSEVSGLGLPVLAVPGNHEYNAGRLDAVLEIFRNGGICVLDGDTTEFVIRGESVGIVGTKGARGGFGEHALESTGEPDVEFWLRLRAEEVSKLEDGLGRLLTDYRVVMLHCAPVRDTVEGEAPEQIPFYGSSALAEPADRLGATLIVHGHSHHGRHHGKTPGGIPVYNVAATVIEAPYVVLEMGI
jgi:Icc-related predicted phosphoesterase